MKTLFVVGAGASSDFGLPVGSALQSQIAAFLKPDRSAEDFGRDIEFAVSELARRGLGYNDLFSTLEWMSQTLPLARSIDSFLETQSQDGDAISFLGKYAIATLIAKGEAGSKLHIANKNHKPDFQRLSRSWLGQLWPLINKGGAARVDEKGLSKFAFLTFNYDRCIEKFLYHAFHHFYRLPSPQAIDFVDSVSIHHVFGSLGDGLRANGGLPFGYVDLVEQRLVSARNIKTYSEQLQEHDLNKIRRMFEWSDRIIFIGFSFSPINTNMLESSYVNNGEMKQVYGTAFEMSDFDRSLAEDWCNRVFKRSLSNVSLDNLKGSDFFQSHQLLFS